MTTEETLLDHDPLWYRDAVIYELHVRAFADSDGDGIGDFKGLVTRLDYLQELGVTALWLLPFYPSPLRDDGYDIADYRTIHPQYGTTRDFKTFLREAHKRGLRVITELVINHTSDEHRWFRRALRAKAGSSHRDFYVWSDDADRYSEARVIFQDFETSNWTWHAEAEAYYWHRFYHHQPDLNFDNPAVHRELFRVLDRWLGMGVDGLRLDAIPYLYERDGTNCENLPETHEFLKKLRARVDEKYDDRMLLAEANQWPEDAAAYFGDGDECHMNFHFPIMPRMFMALRQEDRYPIVDILEETPTIPDMCQWAMFLRNHDELTLEMVTDEERDYMYRVYAHDTRARINLGIRRRLAPLLENNRRKIELMNSLLFSLPGTPVLYYGDEIGMGDNFYLGDRNGVRTPMQWSGDRNAGFSEANPQRLYLPVIIDPEYHYESVNVETQIANPSSLLWWMRRMIALRKRHRAFGRGTLEWVNPENRRVLSFVREYDGERILVVANLSRFSQAVSLDLSEYAGRIPVELLGRTRFPDIGDEPWPMTLGPHSYHWFSLETEVERERIEIGRVEPEEETVASIAVPSGKPWEAVFRGRARGRLEDALLTWIPGCRWYAGKGREVRGASIDEVLPAPYDRMSRILLVEVDYVEEETERYVVPVSFARGADGREILEERPGQAICEVEVDSGNGVLHDAAHRQAFAHGLRKAIASRREATGERGAMVGVRDGAAKEIRGDDEALEPAVGGGEQSNTSLFFGDRWVLKLFRRLEPGVNIDREIGRALTARKFPHSPETAGALEYVRGRDRLATVAVLQAFVENEGDAWVHALDAVGRFLERALAERDELADLPRPPDPLERAGAGEPFDWPDEVHERIGAYLESTRLLGRRTAELHGALTEVGEDDPAFEPDPYTSLYQRSVYQSMKNGVAMTWRLLSRRTSSLPEQEREAAEEVASRRDDAMAVFRRLRERRLEGRKIRIHGDYHLGQVLWTGKDFVIIDFEGEPARPIGERRLRRSPLRDVAGMVRSYHYAAWAGLGALAERGLEPADRSTIEGWAGFWHRWATAAYLGGYLETMDEVPSRAALLPSSIEDRRLLLDVFLLDKALYELRYELENRPTWVGIPCRGVLQVLDEATSR